MKNILIFIIFIILIFFLIQLKKNIEKFNNFNNNFTICMKTIYRCNLLKENIKNIRKKFPYVRIIIADDSDDEYKLKNKKAIEEASYNDKNITYIPLPFNSGLSKGRNECVKRVKTEFTIITDDSRFLITKNSVIQNIITFMKKTKVKLVTGFIKGRASKHSSYISSFDYCMDENRKKISKKEIKKIMKEKGNIIIKKKNMDGIRKFRNLEFQDINLGVNCFIANTSILKKNKWDKKRGTNETLTNTEHEDFFLRLWLNDVKLCFCKQFYFKQANKILRKYDKNGILLRRRKIDKSKIYKLVIE